MGSKAVFQLCFFLFFLGFASLAQGDIDYNLRIVNKLNKTELIVDCSSPDEETGRDLPAGGKFEFAIYEQEYAPYYCHLWKTVGSTHSDTFFKAFSWSKEFLARCGGVHCVWQVREDGVYLYNSKSSNYTRMQVWNKPVISRPHAKLVAAKTEGHN